MALAIAMGMTMATPQAGADPFDSRAVLFGGGPDLGVPAGRAWRGGYAGAELRSDTRLWRGLRPLYGLAVARHGAVLATAGVHGVIRLGPMAVTPHFSLGLWQDGRGGFDGRELVQFRTGIDVFLPLTDTAAIGLGYYHVSNATLTSRSADLDVVRLSILWRL